MIPFFRQCLLPVVASVFIVSSVAGQEAGSLRSMLDSATARYPLLQARQFELLAAQQQSLMAKKQFLPSLDGMYQVNYATYNNITGMNMPQLLMPISGPPSSDNTYSGVFGSAASMLFNWQAISFGRRDAAKQEAAAGIQAATAGQQQETLQLQWKVTHSYIETLAAQSLKQIMQQNLDRTEEEMKAFRPLVTSGIRPGVDTALLRTEIVKARVAFLQAQQLEQQWQLQLAEYVSTERLPALTDTFFLHKLPVSSSVTLPDSMLHPELQSLDAHIAQYEARRNSLSKTAAPVLQWWGTGYARGSGIDYQGQVKSTEGLGLQRFNYGTGLQFSIPLLQKARIKPQINQQELLAKAATEKRKEVARQLQRREDQAAIQLQQSLLLASEMKNLQQSAMYAYEAMSSRYKNGLATLTDLLQVKYSLLKAETESQFACIAAWKAALEMANAKGSFSSFLDQVR